MAQLVLAAAGAALAGPLGFSASIGWMAGSLLASVLFPTKTQGPRLDDRTIVGTEYGQAIPWVAGSPRLAGQYIWASPLREIANTQRAGKGGGAKVTTYTYECDVMIILSENVTAGVARDWLNAELVRNDLTVKEGIWNGVTVYTGEAGQLPDPIYEAAMGAGNAPAYRGRTTIVIRGLQLGGGKQLPNLEHQIVKVGQAIAEDDFKDYSGNNHPVTKALPSAFLGCTSDVAKFGQSGQLDGGAGWGLLIGDAPADTTMGVPALTLECWLYYDLATYQARGLFNNGDFTGSNPRQIIESFFNTGILRITSRSASGNNWAGSGSGQPGCSTNQFPRQQWFHFALTKSGDTWTMFFDGDVENTWISTGVISNTEVGMLGQSFTGEGGWPVLTRESEAEPRSRPPILGAPMVTALAFAIELLLKAVSAAAGKKASRGHKLLALFQGLPDETRAQIQAEFASVTTAKAGRRKDLVATLEMMNDAFEDWRYPYEVKKRGGLMFKPYDAIMLIEAIENVCRSLLAARGLIQVTDGGPIACSCP